VANPSFLVVTTLQALIALLVVLLFLYVVHLQRSSGRPFRDSVERFLVTIKAPLGALLVAGALVVGADFALPPELIGTEIYSQRLINESTTELTYDLCCTGGGNGSCEVPRTTVWALRQPISVQRSRILNRCLVEPSAIPPEPCKCT
jgi:hypothetical protein